MANMNKIAQLYDEIQNNMIRAACMRKRAEDLQGVPNPGANLEMAAPLPPQAEGIPQPPAPKKPGIPPEVTGGIIGKNLGGWLAKTPYGRKAIEKAREAVTGQKSEQPLTDEQLAQIGSVLGGQVGRSAGQVYKNRAEIKAKAKEKAGELLNPKPAQAPTIPPAQPQNPLPNMEKKESYMRKAAFVQTLGRFMEADRQEYMRKQAGPIYSEALSDEPRRPDPDNIPDRPFPDTRRTSLKDAITNRARSIKEKLLDRFRPPVQQGQQQPPMYNNGRNLTPDEAMKLAQPSAAIPRNLTPAQMAAISQQAASNAKQNRQGLGLFGANTRRQLGNAIYNGAARLKKVAPEALMEQGKEINDRSSWLPPGSAY